MSDGLDDIEQLAGTLLRKVGAAERRKLLRGVAREIRASQAARIAAQKEPDGEAFAPRRPRRADTVGAFTVKFLYPKGAANPRKIFMKSWVRQGPLLTGYDTEAGGIRSFFWDKVDQWLPVEADEQTKSGGKFRRQGKIRQRAMFTRLRRAGTLRMASTEDEAWIGWIGAPARVARVHQDGAMDKPAVKAKPVRYARRVLLGLSTAERGLLVDRVVQYLAG
jgi:hypothetical protein